MQRAVGVIPARFSSTRFRGKPLAPLGNGTLLEAVWRQVATASRLDRIIVATDDRRIMTDCDRFGAESMMTSSEHTSGTDRVAEVVATIGDEFSVVVNVQGDEPLVTGTSIDRLVESFDHDRPPAMATLSEPLQTIEDLFDPNIVKIVTNAEGMALYFSRSPIPYTRGNTTELRADFRDSLAGRPDGLTGYLKHQGIYAYGRRTLIELTGLPASRLERDEGLEQLRALEAGYSIRVLPSDFISVGVDTPSDLQRVTALLARERESPDES